MTARKLFLFVMLPVCQLIFAQQDTIALNEVKISDAQLRNFSKTQTVTVLNDSVIVKNAASLTSLLNYNSTLYFKENGLGMVSSPSFRGTTAQQTAVIWNGININSQLNGQTDFNTIQAGGYDNVSVRAGGGSSIYGSSAMGGSVHLNNELRFDNQFKNDFHLNYGSYTTFGTNYIGNISKGKSSAQIGISRNSSENDYAYPNTKNKYNENGQFYNTSMQAAFGYRLSSVHFLKIYSQLFESERHFSGTLAAKSKSKYQDLNTRNLLEWDAISGKWISKVKMAFLSERYKYFENAKTDNFESSQAETLIGKYDLKYNVNSDMSANLVLDYTQTKGNGDAIGENLRHIGAVVLLFKHKVVEKFGYEIALRNEFTDNYESPFLFSGGIYFKPFRYYILVANASRNFRIPTFNDLYWEGLGNPELRPESSNQLEFGQRFERKNLMVSATAFYMDITDMIQWTPNDSGNWKPGNVAQVKSYGTEMLLEWDKKIGKHRYNVHSSYAYVISEDVETDKQLIYVPKHKANLNLAYSYKKISIDYQFLFNGAVFTPSAKYNILKEYLVSNAGIDYDFGRKISCKLGFRVRNLFEEDYQSVLQRPMPGRNYSVCLTLKI